jgi:pyridoxamine 5'-phosphate oxidase-like protein
MEPVAEALDFPEGYGKATAPLPWSVVRTELERAQHYWVTTVRPDGRPHVVPVEGLWIDDAWYYSGSKEAVHYRSVAANPQAVMHLEEATKAFIVEGEVLPIDPAPPLAARLAKVSRQKYGYAPDAGEHAGFLMLSPRRVFAWTAFPKDATRFRFNTNRSH